MDPMQWIQQQMNYDPMQEQRLQYMYEMAQANPDNAEIANAYNNAYMQYMFPSGGDPMMAALGMGGGGGVDLTPDFQTLYGQDASGYTQQQLDEYNKKYGRQGGQIQTLTNQDGSTAQVFIDAMGNPTIISEQAAPQQQSGVAKTGNNWGNIARQIPGVGDLIEGVNFATQMGNAAFNPNVSMPQAYRGWLEEASQNNWRMSLPRKVMGEERFNKGLNYIYDPIKNSSYKSSTGMSNEEIMREGERYNKYLSSLADDEREQFLQDPNDAWKSYQL